MLKLVTDARASYIVMVNTECITQMADPQDEYWNDRATVRDLIAHWEDKLGRTLTHAERMDAAIDNLQWDYHYTRDHVNHL